jgi:hypothetical protein
LTLQLVFKELLAKIQANPDAPSQLLASINIDIDAQLKALAQKVQGFSHSPALI